MAEPQVEVLYQFDDKKAIASYDGRYVVITQKKKKPKVELISPDAASFMIKRHQAAQAQPQEKQASQKILKAFQRALKSGKKVDDDKE